MTDAGVTPEPGTTPEPDDKRDDKGDALAALLAAGDTQQPSASRPCTGLWHALASQYGCSSLAAGVDSPG